MCIVCVHNFCEASCSRKVVVCSLSIIQKKIRRRKEWIDENGFGGVGVENDNNARYTGLCYN